MKNSFSLICLLFLFWACSNSTIRNQDVRAWQQTNDKIRVLTSVMMIEDLVRQIGGEHVATLSLITGELDPHSYQLVKGDDEKLALADLIFYNGLGLEHGPSLQQFLEKNSKAISLGDKIAQTNPDVILHYNGSVDPHIWMDISLWAKTIPSIVRALSEKDPQHADDFQKNGDQLQQQMLETHRQVLGVLGKIPEKQRFLVTSHDAFNYFARAYLADANERETGEWQKRFAAPEGLAPESQLSTINIQAIIDYLKETQVHVLFPESNLSKDSIRKIVSAGSENGLDLVIATDVLYGDAMGKSGSDADTYLKMIEHNARVIAKYLNRPHQQEDEEIH